MAIGYDNIAPRQTVPGIPPHSAPHLNAVGVEYGSRTDQSSCHTCKSAEVDVSRMDNLRSPAHCLRERLGRKGSLCSCSDAVGGPVYGHRFLERIFIRTENGERANVLIAEDCVHR